jgi:hypothetical protein
MNIYDFPQGDAIQGNWLGNWTGTTNAKGLVVFVPSYVVVFHDKDDIIVELLRQLPGLSIVVICNTSREGHPRIADFTKQLHASRPSVTVVSCDQIWLNP